MPATPTTGSTKRPGGRRFGRRALALVVGAAAVTGCGPIVRSSIAPSAVETTVGTVGPADVSGDGRFVVFTTATSGLVPSDHNGLLDVYVRDRQTGVTELVSVASKIGPAAAGNGPSQAPSISTDGRFVAFHSAATDLVAGDTNGQIDVFVHDRANRTTQRVVAPGGAQGNGASVNPQISRDGQFVAFTSLATNLVAGDTNASADVFLFARSGPLTRESVRGAGLQLNGASQIESVSTDGRHVVFSTLATDAVGGDVNGQRDVFWRDRSLSRTVLVSEAASGGTGNGVSAAGSVSGDGRFVAFVSRADNLVAGDTNAKVDAFVRDLVTGAIELVSRVPGGGPLANADSASPAISADGRLVAFGSVATNLGAPAAGFAQVYVHDRTAGTLQVVPVTGGGTPDGHSEQAVFATDGSTLVYVSEATNVVPGDGNGVRDAFAHHLASGTTTRESVASHEPNGRSTLPAISQDGRFVAFESEATNLVPGDTNAGSDVFVRDHTSGAVRRVSEAADGTPGNGASTSASMSGDGRYVAFASSATNLVAGDTNGRSDVFVKDLATGAVQLASVGLDGPGNGHSGNPSISDDGTRVAFSSSANNLVDRDINGATVDVFVRDLTTGSTTLVSVDSRGVQRLGGSFEPRLSGNGRFVVFTTDQALVPGDTNGVLDVFRRDLAGGAGTIARITVGSGGAQLALGGDSGDIDDSGTAIAFRSSSAAVFDDTNGTADIYLRRLPVSGGTSTTVRVSVEAVPGIHLPSSDPSVSDDGRFVAFHSGSNRLVAGDTNGKLDVFVRDVVGGATLRSSVAADGTQAAGNSFLPAIAGSGSHVAFVSDATTLAAPDTNGTADVFRRTVQFP